MITLERQVQNVLVRALDDANLGKQTPWGSAGLVVTLTDLVIKGATNKTRAVIALRAFAEAINEAAYSLDASPDAEDPK